MIKLSNIYENLITEKGVEYCIKNFGKELFSPQLGGYEPNTDTEEFYLTAIDNYTEKHYGVDTRDDFVDMMYNLKKCMSTYPEVLQPRGWAYRGENLTVKAMVDAYDKIEGDIEGGIFKMLYKAQSKIQSWTSDKSVALDFAKIDPEFLRILRNVLDAKREGKVQEFIEGNYDRIIAFTIPIIIEYKTTKDDFLFKSEYFKYLSQHEYEDELLRIDNKPIVVGVEVDNSIRRKVALLIRSMVEFG